ncbi:MAG: EAL domain-containing protein [Deltaproteobacteria bacterium]|nr:EAL domain-containing protein [Deltaproteobacteria bacterium]MCB9788894.1 EAL domain-containing protein [Deltaproteobacteria bacterium]
MLPSAASARDATDAGPFSSLRSSSLVRALGVAVLCWVAALLGLALGLNPSSPADVWPAAGVALAGLLAGGIRLWPGAFAGVALALLSGYSAPDGRALLVAATVATGVTFQAVAGARLVARFVGYPTPLARERDIFAFLGLAGPAATVIAPTLGLPILALARVVPVDSLPSAWLAWWLGDACGVMILAPVLLCFLGQPRAAWRRRRASVATPVLVAFVALHSLLIQSRAEDTRRVASEFNQRARVVEDALGASLDRYLLVLRAVGEYVAAAPPADAASFERFALAQLEGFDDSTTLGWHRLISDDDIAALEQDKRAHGWPGFTVHGGRTAAATTPPPRHQPHLIVEYLAPLAGRGAYLGFDMLSEPQRHATFARARDSGRPVATPPLRLLDGMPGSRGIIVFYPIYSGPVPTTIEERRLAIRGAATGVFRLDDFADTALPSHWPEGVEAWVVDETGGAPGRPLFAHASTRAPHAGTFSYTSSVELAGRQWTLRVISAPGFMEARRALAPWLILGGGVVLVTFLGAFLLALTGRAAIDEARAAMLAAANADLEHQFNERTRVERELADANDRALVTLDSIGEAVITSDALAVIDYMNPVAESLIGVTNDEARGHRLSQFGRCLDEKTREPLRDPIETCLRDTVPTSSTGIGILVRTDEVEHAIEYTTAPIRNTGGEVLGAVLVFKDVTEARQTARQMAHHAMHDALTGLVNRREFERRLSHAVASARLQGARHALCYLDLDQFKLVNDTAGHAAGDELLKQLTDVLRRAVRSRDTLARLGGDEFGLLLSNCPQDKAHEIAESIVTAIRGFRFSWQERTFQVGVSIGLVPIESDADGTDSLLSKADVACYTAKDLGRNRVYTYDTNNAYPKRRHAELVQAAELRDALEQGRFRLWHQPIAALDRDSTENFRCELLLRLEDPNGGIVAPGAFIPAAERYGLMGSLDRWVIQTAFRSYHEAFAERPNTQMSINLSGNTLTDDGLARFVRRELESAGLSGDRVCFEITETAAVQHLGPAVRFIGEMRSLGCRFALDDFGSGLSSFGYLKQLAVDYLKIDGGFVRGITESRIDGAMVSAINDVGHEMSLRTVAEYAETEAIVEQLRRLGVDYAQGFAVGRPVPLPGRAGMSTRGRERYLA